MADQHLIMAAHTTAHWPTELYLPSAIVDRDNREAWMKPGSKDTYQRACDEVDRRLAAYRQLETDPAIDAELRRIIRSGLADPSAPCPRSPSPPSPSSSPAGVGERRHNRRREAGARPASQEDPAIMTTPLATPATEASSTLYFGPWYRRSPFFEKTLEAGCSAYDIYNHMYLPGYYADPIEEYWALLNDVTVWDVSVERIVEITGSDASAFTNMLTCRDLTKCAVGQGKYMLVTAEDGGIVNDPVLLRIEENRWWMALADSDAGLWARGVATHAGMDVKVREPEVYPVQVQGPKSKDVMRTIFGPAIDDIKYYWTLTTEVDGIPVVISRTGWTGEVGYEVYLRDPSRGGDLWDRLMEAGKPHKIRPIAPCEARRIEAGIFNYGSDMTIADTPFHVMGLERLVETQDADYIGKAALEEIRAEGRRPQARRHRGRRATRSRSSCRASATRCRTARPSGPSPTSSGRRGSRRTSATSGCRSSWPGRATRSRSSLPTAASGRRGPPRSRSSTRRRPCRSAEPVRQETPVTRARPLTPDEIAAVRKPYRAASLLPGRAYHDPAIHDFERNEWFRRDWIVVGRE